MTMTLCVYNRKGNAGEMELGLHKQYRLTVLAFTISAAAIIQKSLH